MAIHGGKSDKAIIAAADPQLGCLEDCRKTRFKLRPDDRKGQKSRAYEIRKPRKRESPTLC